MGKWAGWIGLPLGLVGCMGAPSPGPFAGEAAGHASLVLSAEVTNGDYVAQTLLAPWTRSSIQHVVLKLSIASGSTETPVMVGGTQVQKDVASPSLSVPVTMANLRNNVTYRVRAYAYKANGTSASDLISLDAQSYIDVPVYTDDRPTAGTFKVRLKDTVFDGEATSSGGIAVTDGTFVPAASESLN